MGFKRLLTISAIIILASWAILLQNTIAHEQQHALNNEYLGGNNDNAKTKINYITTAGSINGRTINNQTMKEVAMLDAINEIVTYNTTTIIASLFISLFILILYLESRTED